MAPKPQTRRLVERERELSRLATRQYGVVTRRQSQAIGFGDEAIKQRLEAGRLTPFHREVYAVGHRHIERRGRWLAAVMAYGDRALLSHRSAAALWGIARSGSHAIDVTAPTGRQGHLRRKRLWIHRCQLHREDRTVRAGIPVTSIARTLFDMAEVVDFGRLKAAWEEADRLNLLQLRAVDQVCERGYGRRALRPTRRLLAEYRAPEITSSPLEERFAAFCEAHQIPPPATNVVVLGFEVDALWPAARLIVELDGFAFHRHRAAFECDRTRDGALQAAGYRVVRLTHRRLTRDGAEVAQLRAMLRASKGEVDGEA